MREYPQIDQVAKICNGVVGKRVIIMAAFEGEELLPVNCPDIVGNIIQELLYPLLNKHLPDIEKGPPQQSPDYWGLKREFAFEVKAYYNSPGFDIANVESLINQLVDNGVIKKILKTKYLIFEYDIKEATITIKKFWLKNIWELPNYGLTYPISLQQKGKTWLNFRSAASSKWNNPDKNPIKFIENIIECIDKCHHVDNKETKKASILRQLDDAKAQGFI